ncbi:RluA family pseudouridine synthase [Candidatus Odyssella acanthamoebae]|uniref:Pseudouridine synthase n=1 Tax=Candidatus Odyssella acanthamoebae TaxID=91604 RepID=A0A077AYQ0_9PROT|nr:RNA pseudouridine synthase [Candidatus Paracaedibacter acanthamoebae]AIK95845.1 pseudouridine synthase [Candidatus Paracaedibacter acanthamoebae]
MISHQLSLEDLLLYRDAMILVINKPKGYAVHKGKGRKPNLEDYFHQLQFGLPTVPGLGHRLDASTSGCLVLGRHAKALRRLGILFSSGQIKKTYWAIVRGHLPQKQGRIDLPLAKMNDRKSSWWMKVDPQGQKAITEYKVLGEIDDYSFVELSPITGRTHQLRVHLDALGCPIVGDPVYGREVPDLDDDNLHLLARSIEIPLSSKKNPIRVIAPVPSHMLALLNQFEELENAIL